MKTVGVRELKNRLSEYLRQVRSGESVLVTDRGQVVAELTAPGQGATDASVPAGLLALARRNLLVTRPGTSFGWDPRSWTAPGSRFQAIHFARSTPFTSPR